MKKVVKKNYRIVIGLIIGILISTTVTYAAQTVLSGNEVSYNNETSGGNSNTVQGAIDDLYKKTKELTGEGDTKYTESILNGADPVLGKGMIPVTIDAKGKVKYASENAPWYSYEEKRWANAVILVNGKTHKVGDEIPEEDISAYFVWIPRYSYKIWDTGNYTNPRFLNNLVDDSNAAKTNNDTSLRRITGNARLIDIQFGANKNDSGTTVDSYYTHPAFTLGDKKLNGIWVGKFEISGNSTNIKVKPGVESWHDGIVGTFWNALYNYNRNLDSHMMKNTEWGAVAYLSHSIYGKGSEININNNSNHLTGYSAAANTDQSTTPGESGTGTDKTQPWNTSTGYLASTTGNITGIYDMSGGAWEYMAAYVDGSDTKISGLTDENLIKYSNYFDRYDSKSTNTSMDKRILGDATGEMGPFYYYYDKDGYIRVHNAWYADNSNFVDSNSPWFVRGGYSSTGVLAGQFFFYSFSGGSSGLNSARLVLALTES